jgi:hypothetical protein
MMKFSPDSEIRQTVAKKYIENPWAMLILDDCTDKVSDLKKEIQHTFFKLGRHWKMLYILSMQTAMDVAPFIRRTNDIVFIMRDNILSSRRILFENYASMVGDGDFNIFCKVMDQITDDHTALVIWNNPNSQKWTDCVFYFKATPVPEDFKFGCKEYWDFHFSRFNPDYHG